MIGVRKVSLALLLLLTCAVGAGVVYLVEHDVPIRNAGTTPTDTFFPPPPTRPESSAPTTDLPSTGAPSSGATTSPPSATKITFLGDDYTAGVGANPQSKSWTQLVGKQLHVEVTVVGESGAGYAKKSGDGKMYSSLVDKVVASTPDLVVVSGGRNDVGDASSTLHAAAHALFASLHQKLPNARLLAIAPWWGDSPHPAPLNTVDQAVRSGVRAAGGKYVNKPDPLGGHPGFMKDAADPNNKGYRAIADSVTSAIGAQLPR
jgi:lysophospholipase L1-like esterase